MPLRPPPAGSGAPVALRAPRLTWFLSSTGGWALASGLHQVIFTWLVVGVLHETPDRVGVSQMCQTLPLLLFLLFGGLLAWAVIAVIGTNRRDGPRAALPEWDATSTVIHALVAILVFVTIAWLHSLTGYSPLPG